MKVLAKDYGIDDLVRELRDIRSRTYDCEVEALIDKLLKSYDENRAISNGYESSTMRVLGGMIAQDIKEHSNYLCYITVYETSAVWYNPKNECIFTDIYDGQESDEYVCTSLALKVGEHIWEKCINQIYTGNQEKAYSCVRYYDADYDGGLEEEIVVYFAELVAAIESN